MRATAAAALFVRITRRRVCLLSSHETHHGRAGTTISVCLCFFISSFSSLHFFAADPEPQSAWEAIFEPGEATVYLNKLTGVETDDVPDDLIG